jgi:hypothetical protein
MRRTRRHPPWIMFENNPQIHERQILDISECPKLVADVDPPIGASFRLSAVAQGVVGRRREVVRCKGRTIGIRIAAATSKTEWPHAFPIELLSNNRRQGLRYATSICCSPRRPLAYAPTRKSRCRVEVGNGSLGTHATHSRFGARIKMSHDG